MISDDDARPKPHGRDGRYSMAQLRDVMARLRDPETGCPWDIRQSFTSIAPYTIEEAFEVADAIERGDLVDLKEELGDLLLQVIYHSQIASEQSAFDLDDVVHAIAEKMIRRHPHVFGTQAERTQGPEPGFWERIKVEEKRARAQARQHVTKGQPATHSESLLDEVPRNLPALTQAVKLQKKAARVGFDWATLSPVLDKMREELDELSAAIDGDQTDAIEEEFGDLLFVMANVARHLNVDPESGLRQTNEKFRRRFRAIEIALANQGRTPDMASLEEMDTLWNAAKRAERQTLD